jgi:hypothetical protein
MFESDYYAVDVTTGKVASWLEKSTHPTGILSIDPIHAMSQSTSALQCAVPVANSLFRGCVSATFVDQRYISHAAASAWRFLHDGTGFAVYTVRSFASLSGAKYFLSTSYGGTVVGFNTGTGSATQSGFVANVGAAIAAPNGGTFATATAYSTRMRYEEGASPEVDLYRGATSMASTAATSAAPATGVDPTATLMMGNRVVIVDAPFVGDWCSTIICKGTYSAATDALINLYFTAKYGVT